MITVHLFVASREYPIRDLEDNLEEHLVVHLEALEDSLDSHSVGRDSLLDVPSVVTREDSLVSLLEGTNRELSTRISKINVLIKPTMCFSFIVGTYDRNVFLMLTTKT